MKHILLIFISAFALFSCSNSSSTKDAKGTSISFNITNAPPGSTVELSRLDLKADRQGRIGPAPGMNIDSKPLNSDGTLELKYEKFEKGIYGAIIQARQYFILVDNEDNNNIKLTADYNNSTPFTQSVEGSAESTAFLEFANIAMKDRANRTKNYIEFANNTETSIAPALSLFMMEAPVPVDTDFAGEGQLLLVY